MSNSEPSSDRQSRYERVLSTIEQQTSPVQLPGCRERAIKLCLIAHGPLTDAEKLEKSIRATVENGDCLKWADRDGETRYTLTDNDALRRLLVYEARQENPRSELKDRIKTHLPSA